MERTRAVSPRVTVVIPAYNAAGFLEDCLRGIRAQTFPLEEAEILLIDDGSTDGTLEKARFLKEQFRLETLEIIHQQNAGPAAARNVGVSRATAGITVFLDSDCVPRPDWLAHLIIPLQDDPLIQGVEGRTVPASPNCTLLDHFIENQKGGVYWTCNMAYRTQTLRRIGGFDEGFPWPAGEDIDIAHRIKQVGELVFEPQAVVEHLVLPRSFKSHIGRAKMFSSMIRLWRKHPGLLIPANTTFRDLVGYQLHGLLYSIVTQRRWLLKNPPVYFQFCLIMLCMTVMTVAKLPDYHREAHRPLEVREPLS